MNQLILKINPRSPIEEQVVEEHNVHLAHDCIKSLRISTTPKLDLQRADKSSPHSKQRGFTLIELSIVIVIIGLIIGGILTGQELIHGARVKATISQIIQYNSAVNAFQMKYSALPGDFSTADTYITGATNGDGNGLIGAVDGATPSGVFRSSNVPASVEYGNFWSQLSATGLIEGNYNAITIGSTTVSAGTNFPRTSVSSLVGIFAYGNQNDNINYYHLGLSFVSPAVTANTFNFLSPNNAYDIDSKIDDGKPATGIVAARGTTYAIEAAPTVTGSNTLSTTNSSQCVLGTTPQSSPGYNIIGTMSPLCQLRIKIN